MSQLAIHRCFIPVFLAFHFSYCWGVHGTCLLHATTRRGGEQFSNKRAVVRFY